MIIMPEAPGPQGMNRRMTISESYTTFPTIMKKDEYNKIALRNHIS